MTAERAWSRLRQAAPFVLLALAVAAFFYKLGDAARVREDAYITFRVVDNFINGYGLRWNVHERVQAYTNPLWMLLHIPFYAVWKNIFVITLMLSGLCMLGAILLTWRAVRCPPVTFIALFIVPLIYSRAIIAHSASGLENPLMHLLFAWAGWIVLRAGPKRFWLWLSLATSLAMVNRLDTVIILAPLWVYLLISRRHAIRYKQIIAGALPIIGWLSFSLFYYGFIFPNTKYAKLDTGIDPALYFEQGLNYLRNLAAIDPVSAAWLAAGVLAGIALLLLAVWKKRQEEYALLASIGIGILLYSLYVIVVGGTHTFGLFWTLSVFASCWLLLAWGAHYRYVPAVAAVVACLALHALAPATIAEAKKQCQQCFKGMLKIDLQEPRLKRYLIGKAHVPRPGAMKSERIKKMGGVTRDARIGIMGYRAGPSLIIIDRMALPDALLARLPASAQKIYRVGHIVRRIPNGYLEAVKTGDASGMDSDLQEYYAPLRLIISGDLWDWQRLVALVKFQLGAYDEARGRYLAKKRVIYPRDPTVRKRAS